MTFQLPPICTSINHLHLDELQCIVGSWDVSQISDVTYLGKWATCRQFSTLIFVIDKFGEYIVLYFVSSRMRSSYWIVKSWKKYRKKIIIWPIGIYLSSTIGPPFSAKEYIYSWMRTCTKITKININTSSSFSLIMSLVRNIFFYFKKRCICQN